MNRNAATTRPCTNPSEAGTGRHTIWPWITYFSAILASAYEDFEKRVAAARSQTGSKRERVREHILEHAPGEFRRRDVERALPE